MTSVTNAPHDQTTNGPHGLQSSTERPGVSDSRPVDPGRVASAKADQNRKLAYLSYLRIVAIVGVVVMHISGRIVDNPALHGKPVWHVAVLFTVGSHWRVSILVMVSGALLLRPVSGESVGDFYRKRLKRIGIPLATWHVVYLVFTGTVLGVELTASKVLELLASGKVYTALYFFWLILGLYLVTPVIRTFIAHSSRRDQWIIAWIALAGGVLYEMIGSYISYQGGKGNGPYNAVTFFLPYVGYFMMGYLLRDLRLSRLGQILAGIAVVLLCVERVWQFENMADLTWLNILSDLDYRGSLAAIYSLLVFMLVSSLIHPRSTLAQPPYAQVARRIGNKTMGVYAIHLLVLYFLLDLFGIPKGPAGFKYLGVVIVLTLLVSFVVSYVMSKIPFVRRAV